MKTECRRASLRGLSIAALAVGSLFVATAASADGCPADKRGKGLTKPATHAAKNVSDTVLASIDLAKDTAVNLPDRKFRLRRLEVQPGGVVPWHSHEDRPAIIYIVQGEISEFASTCAVGIVHKPGEVAAELRDSSHWWQNMGTQPAVLLSADLLREVNDKNM
jgi:quercetin dioxygenase-like cupin family protein